MWPFSEMSLPVASLVGTIANWLLLASLVGGVLSTFVIVKATDVKEEHWADDRRKSNEKTADLEMQGDQAKAELGVAQADIAKANAQIAEAEARAKEAELKLEQLRKEVAPRQLGPEFLEALKGQPGANVQVLYVRDAPDTYAFAMQIFFQMSQLPGWKVSFPETIREDMRDGPSRSFDLPAATWVRGQPAGVSIVSGRGFEDATGVDITESKTAVGALVRAFLASLQRVSWSGDPALPENTLRIVVAPKL
jgi:hypothetical protein